MFNRSLKLVCLVVYSMTLAAFLHAGFAEAMADVFVSTAGRDDWSGTLSTPNPAGSDGPFATVTRALVVARDAGPTPRRIVVRGGNYYLAAPVRIGHEDTGIDITAYPGETPILNGGLPVRGTGLGVESDDIAPPPSQALPILIAGETIVPVARLPDAGPDDIEEAWRFATASPGDLDVHRSFRVRSEDADMMVAAATPGAQVTIFGQRGWQDFVLPVESVDTDRNVITLAGTTWDRLGEGSRFAILNGHPSPGHWRYDRNRRNLALQGLNSTPERPIVAAVVPCIFAVDATADVTIRGLRLIGSSSEGAGVCVSGSSHITLDQLRISATGNGIWLDQSRDVRISNSEIDHTASHGVTLRRRSDGNLVTGNFIHDVGWLHQDASAIWFEEASDNRFVQNRIERVSKFGIGGGSFAGGSSYGNRVEDNEIDQTNQRTSDGGGILVIGWSQDATNDRISGNVVTRTAALGNVGWDNEPHVRFQDKLTRLVSEAIYLDDWASAVTVTGNLLCANLGGIELHAGWNNQVQDNVLLGNAGIALGVDAQNWLGSGAHPHTMENNLITRNIVIIDQSATGQSGIVAVRGGNGVATFDYNLYAGPGLNDRAFHQEQPGAISPYSFGEHSWRDRGQDTHSTIGRAAARAVLRSGAVEIIGPDGPIRSLPLDRVGRSKDRDGLAQRLRTRCGLM